ncbi:MAG: glycosyltransferase 87 family protein [Thermoanaerobaculia bacterium]|nr:glycosyltransferase 87 family protein [Thermoanaerobaculia bacterium]
MGILLAAMACLAYGARRLAAPAGSQAVGILVVAGLLRVLLLPLPPTLSDDVLRYVWDGRVTLAGFDPYRLPPEDEALEGLRDELWRRLPHREVPTVYPPLAVALFSTAALSPAPVTTLKLLLSAADLAGCWLLLGIARRRGLPEARVALYAWNPLVVLETAGMGHVDALGCAAAIAAVAWVTLDRPRVRRSAAAAAVAALAKLVPLAALPAWARASRRPLLFAGVALAITLAAAAPVAIAADGVPPGLVTYGVSWEFNGPLYEPLWRLLDRVGARERVEELLDRRKEIDGRHELWNRFYPFNYPQLLAKLLLAPGLLAAILWAWRRGRDPVAASGVVFGGLLLFSATVYPWYLIWVLPWAALCRQPAWLLLSAAMPLSYLPQLTALPLWPWTFLVIWAPFWVVLAGRPRWSTC